MPRVFLAQPSHQLLIARMFLKRADYFLELIQKNIDNQKLDMSKYVSMMGNFPLLPYYGIFALKYMVISLQIIRCESLQIKDIISIADIKNLESNIEIDKTINDVIDVNLFRDKLPKYPSYHDRKKDDPEKYLIKAESWHEGLKSVFSEVENKLKEFAFSENEKESLYRR